MSLETQGFQRLPGLLPGEMLETLRNGLFRAETAGERCLLDHPAVRETAIHLKQHLIRSGHLAPAAVAIQAIAFDKNAATNWKVGWHQDLMFPFAEPVSADGFELPSIKQGIHYARPPAEVLEQLLAVRLHLDECDSTNGPLRVSPGSHRSGIIPTSEIPQWIADHDETTCLAGAGELLLMRPLLLHASSQATAPKHRRVLHLVFHCGPPLPETWHRAV